MNPKTPEIMIAKITTRVDFSGIVNYANNKREKSARIIGSNGVLLFDNSTIADSFQAQLRIPDANGKLHHLSKPVKHISIAFSPEDAVRFPDNEEGDRFMAQLAEEWLREMGIDPENTQYVIARHFDKEHPHCHLVFNRIAKDGSVISDSNERRRNETACRRIKQRHGLTFGDSRSQKIIPERLRRYDAWRLQIRQLALDCLTRSKDWHTFSFLMSKEGINLSFSIAEKTGQKQGLSFELGGFRISGSKLGLHGRFTYGNLCKQLGGLKTCQDFKRRVERARLPEVVKERTVIYIPVIRYLEIISRSLLNPSSSIGSSSINREHEVGQGSRSWSLVDDRIEEERVTYKLRF